MKDTHDCHIGIDLGTSMSCAVYCYYQSGFQFKTIEHECEDFLPSVVTYSSEFSTHIGLSGIEHSKIYPQTSIKNSKRCIGIMYNDSRLINDSEALPYEIVCNDKGMAAFELIFENNKSLIVDPIDIATRLLTEIKNNAMDSLDKEVTGAVVTVPAYFNDRQRNVTKSAAQAAGFKEVQILDEPVAAAIAYGTTSGLKDNGEKILVFDLGGGTFDVSVINYLENDYTVLATEGDSHLGGLDFDTCLYNHFNNEINQTHNIDVSKDSESKVKLLSECEKIKISLSRYNNVTRNVYINRVGNYNLRIDRSTFENLSSYLFQRINDTIDNTIKQASVESGDINRIILVGGSSKIPYIFDNLLIDKFPESKICRDIDTSKAVAYGASIKAAFNSGNSGSNGEKLNINNVTSLSVGVNVKHGIFRIIVPKKTKLPCEMSSTFVTGYDNQKLVTFCIYQGERPIAIKNIYIQKLSLSVPSKPRGQVGITLTFRIDEDKVLTIKARENTDGNEKWLTINNNFDLPDNDVLRMNVEAEEEKERDYNENFFAQKKEDFDKNMLKLTNEIRELNSNDKKKEKLYELLNDSVNRVKKLNSIVEFEKEVEELGKHLEKTLGKHKHIMIKYKLDGLE